MISWREELRQLAEIESELGNAITFYFQPETPEDVSHRHEFILAKDLVREALKNLEASGDHNGARGDLERILATAENLHGNHSRARAIFACADLSLWREFDLPPNIDRTQLHVNNRFHLKPLASVVSQAPHALVTVVDRERARLFQLEMNELTLREEFQDELPRRGRGGDGFSGLDAGHSERHVENEAMRHFKKVADRLQELHTNGEMPTLIIGCRPETWSAVEQHLHPYVKKALAGRLDLDPGISEERIRSEALILLEEQAKGEQQANIREVLGEVQRDGRGSVGLKHVLTSLERGEVQHLLIGNTFSAAAVECTHCGHLDTRRVSNCAVCSHATREVEDVGDALIGYALRNGVDISYVDGDEDFLKAGNIAALLRFRADQSTPAKLAG
jgi:peptide subunit release factor 1 (eRF1)